MADKKTEPWWKKLAEQMKDSAQVRFNMGEYGVASSLRKWADKLEREGRVHDRDSSR